jgi:hypothetical protein
MKLTDQEQVILKAIGSGVVEVSRVIKAVGYPKATVKKILIGLSNKGVVSLHRHDWPASLKPEQRKLMVRIGSNYYSAVSMRKRNSEKKSKGKTALKKTGRALKGFTRGALAAGAEILGAGAEALNPVRRKIRNKYIDLVIKGQAKKTPQGWRVGKKTFAQGRGTVNVSSGYYLDRHTGMVYAKRERNMASRKKRRRRNVEMGFYDASGFHPIRASSDYSEGQRPSRSKRAKTAKRKATATASHRRRVSSRKATKKSLAGRSLKRTTATGKRLKRKRNISEGFYDASGVFHPIRAASDYSPSAAGETGGRSHRTRSKKKTVAKRKASATARRKSGIRTRKATTRIASRGLSKRTATGKRLKRARNTGPTVLALVNGTSPKARANRKEFAGEYRKDTPLRFPEGTPTGLSKLGKLIKIKTKTSMVAPTFGHTWLVRDLKGKLHIGTTNKDGEIWHGPVTNFGKVMLIEYQDVKKHLGYSKQTIFFHHIGEENGKRPTLHADGKGGLKFRGGDYRITPEGIVN